MADQLSGIAIIICIAFGVLTFILLFIFAKRQITRFALKSRRGPHVPTANDASKKLFREIERRLNVVRTIQYEPPLLNKENENLFSDSASVKEISPPHLYRMKAVEDVKNLDVLISYKRLSRRRRPGEDVQSYYLKLYKDKKLSNLTLADLNKFLLLYEQARFGTQEFQYEEYKNCTVLLENIRNSICGNIVLSENPVEKHFPIIDGEKTQPTESTSFLMKKSVSFDLTSSKCKNSAPLETPV